MKLGVLGAATATGTLFLGAMVSLSAGQAEGPATVQTLAAGTPKKFDHAQHAVLDKAVDVGDCTACHGDDADGVLKTPGQIGHQPCFSSGCHVGDFLSVGSRTRTEAPERYAKAAAFCQGCHASAEGVAPSPARETKADNAYRNNANPGHYVEFNHLEHTERTQCRTCHVVDAATFALDLGSPSHAQCASCHKDNEEYGMARCTSCHHSGSPSGYFKERTFKSDVRSCKSERYQRLLSAGKSRPPCFEHEREGHRLGKDGKDVQCNDCHFMFKARTYAGHNYETLRGIKQAPLMDNARDQAHKKCGSAGCHAREVEESEGLGRCGTCHSTRSILDSLVDGPSEGRFDDQPKDISTKKSKGSGLRDLIESDDSSSGPKRRKKNPLEDLVE